MKTNLSNLMITVAEDERKLAEKMEIVRELAQSTSIQELDGTITITEDNEKDFKEALEECENFRVRISKLKAILYSKNNEYRLSDGRTIQNAIFDNMNMRRIKETYEYLISLRNSKERITEVHNSYFVCKNVNFDIDEIKRKLTEIEDSIMTADFEISKLNSIEFEVKD